VDGRDEPGHDGRSRLLLSRKTQKARDIVAGLSFAAVKRDQRFEVGT
jgi:hypothetical protein